MPFIKEVLPFEEVDAPILFVEVFPPKNFITLEGSKIGIFKTSIVGCTSSRSEWSSTGTSGFSGVKITGSQPSSGKNLENFNHL